MLGSEDLMPEFWLEVSLHSEGPATSQLDQCFPWFSLVPEQMLSWYPNSTLHCMLPMQPSQLEISFCSNVTSKYKDLALQVGGVSDETVKYGREFCGTST
jgi:hypothetical protein